MDTELEERLHTDIRVIENNGNLTTPWGVSYFNQVRIGNTGIALNSVADFEGGQDYLLLDFTPEGAIGKSNQTDDARKHVKMFFVGLRAMLDQIIAEDSSPVVKNMRPKFLGVVESNPPFINFLNRELPGFSSKSPDFTIQAKHGVFVDQLLGNDTFMASLRQKATQFEEEELIIYPGRYGGLIR